MTIRVQDFERVVCFTGAGLSADSGVPTYRGKGGIWKEYDYQRYACQPAFDEDPARVWEFHNYRRGLVAACQPNRGHQLIAEAQAARPALSIITQNIDGLHQRAGSRRVLELHGSLWRVRCDACRTQRDSLDVPFNALQCPCGAGFWRPDITWFGDALDTSVWQAALQQCQRADLFLSIGTSGVVYPAAHLPEVAKRAGALLVEVNLEQTEASELYDHVYRGNASDVLASLMVAG